MIVEKTPLPQDPTPTDAPPSYDDVGSSAGTTRLFPTDAKLPPIPDEPITPIPKSPYPKSPIPSGSSSKGKGPATWFSFGFSSRSGREVRTTVLGLVRDLVRHHNSDATSALGILQSCAEACAAYDLSLSTILQERSVEDHTPLYWAIIKRQPDESMDEDMQIPDLLTTLLSFSAPLTPETISEIRLACLITSDQQLFQRLRLSPEFSPLSGTDQMILGGSIPPDDITVEDTVGDEGAFAVNMGIVQFQKRMQVSREVVVEFIARCESFQLVLVVMPSQEAAEKYHTRSLRPGTWCVTLSLLEHSPPTWIDSRLLIADSGDPPGDSVTTPPLTPSASPPLISLPFSASPSSPSRKPKPTISLRLKCSEQLIPLEGARRHPRNAQSVIVTPLEDSLMGASLQYSGTSYIAKDSVLRARLEARLRKPEAECVIC
ncbi:hypothetical protein EYR36_004094 [Pleurotus pulmonarius]|nr:hypothetical protein EYR36_004094 [Pleurotus pulmonarius]